MKIVVYDLEIQTPIDNVNVKWTDYPKMGISVGCAFDYSVGEYKVFLEDNLQELVDLLNDADLVVAFNHLGFDNPLLRATVKVLGLPRQLKLDAELKNYDMLEESKKGAKAERYAKGYKLDDHLRHTFGEHMLKTEHGGNAPILWQEAQLGKLISYCLADVHRERMLFEEIWRVGQVKVSPRPHPVARPQARLGLTEESSLPWMIR